MHDVRPDEALAGVRERLRDGGQHPEPERAPERDGAVFDSTTTLNRAADQCLPASSSLCRRRRTHRKAHSLSASPVTALPPVVGIHGEVQQPVRPVPAHPRPRPRRPGGTPHPGMSPRLSPDAVAVAGLPRRAIVRADAADCPTTQASRQISNRPANSVDLRGTTPPNPVVVDGGIVRTAPVAMGDVPHRLRGDLVALTAGRQPMTASDGPGDRGWWLFVGVGVGVVARVRGRVGERVSRVAAAG